MGRHAMQEAHKEFASELESTLLESAVDLSQGWTAKMMCWMGWMVEMTPLRRWSIFWSCCQRRRRVVFCLIVLGVAMAWNAAETSVKGRLNRIDCNRSCCRMNIAGKK